MMKITTLVMLGAVLLGTASSVIAHPGHSHRKTSTPTNHVEPAVGDRTWTASSGAFRERGSFVMARDGSIQIRRADDSLVDIPIQSLLPADQLWVAQRLEQIRQTLEKRGPVELQLAQRDPITKAPAVGKTQVPEMAAAFEAFVKLKAIKTRWDDRYFYVESNGIPDHRLMVGITAWQQQVPLPQKYVGDNAWQIPLHPVPAQTPATTKDRFLRGAIAVAVNGIPIFNPLNNRGDDAYLFGELDEFGGHCGRADDYHYHLAPVHLQKTVGKGQPIAYALDGYPIYGFEEPDGSKVKNLDKLNGHKDEHGKYHYHATKTYPYLNGGFFGEVSERGGQVDPQPRAEPLRPDLRPLRDAKIIDFKEPKPGSYELTYDVRGRKGAVNYRLNADGSVKFSFVDIDGRTTSETYTPRRRGPGDDRRPPPPRDGKRPPPPPRED